MREKNNMALTLLEKQDWKGAQQLFRYNAKKHPCYQTYNNYGYYLVTEGMLCKNGQTQSALNLGINYLVKALDIKLTVTSICALVKAIEYKTRTVKPTEKTILYEYACKLLEKGIETEYSHKMQYNLLRFQYLLNPQNKKMLDQVRSLVNNFTSSESVLLYLGILGKNTLQNEGNECIAKYSEYIDDVELLMFYAKTEQYEKGYCLCEKVYKNFSMDKFISSAIIECCVNTKHFEDVLFYSREVMRASGKNKDLNEKLTSKILSNLSSSTNYRKTIINSYFCVPPYLDQCCYFGCALHGTPW